MSRIRQISWGALIITLAVEGLFLGGIISLAVVTVNKSKPQIMVMDLLPNQQASSAPASPAPAQKQEKPVVQTKPETAIIIPKAQVQMPQLTQPVRAAPAAPAPPAPAAEAAPKPAPAAPSAGAGPVNVANLSTNILSGAPPSFPTSARRKREQGKVLLRLVISEQGLVVDIAVSRSSGFPSLDEAAIAAVRKWRWSPMIRDGRPVMVTGTVLIPFVLRDS